MTILSSPARGFQQPAVSSRQRLGKPGPFRQAAEYWCAGDGGGPPHRHPLRSRVLQEPEIEGSEHQDDSDIHGQPRPELVLEEQDVHADKSAADPPNGHDDRRPRKRRGLGLGVTVTGAIAGIIIVGLLILGNLPTAGDSDAPVGAIATVSRSTPHATGTNSGTGAPTLAGNDSSAAAHSNPSATSASPSSSTSSPPTSASTAPAQSATSTQAEQPTSPSTTTSSAHSSPTATQSTTSPASPSPSPSQSQTHVSCILIICW